MLKKPLILLVVFAVGLVILRPYGVITQIDTLDRGIGFIDGSIRQFGRSLASIRVDSVGSPENERRLSSAADRVATLFGADSTTEVPDGEAALEADRVGEGSEGEVYQLRVAAFRDADNAERVAGALRDRHLEVVLSADSDDLRTVTVGPFRDRAAAEQAARTVEEATGLIPQVIH